MTFAQYAPAHTVGSRRRIPKGTVLVGFDQQPEASAFNGYPERYDELEGVLVPASERESPGYAGGYAVTMYSADIGGLLERIEPANPRPTENRLPRLSRLGSRPD